MGMLRYMLWHQGVKTSQFRMPCKLHAHLWNNTLPRILYNLKAKKKGEECIRLNKAKTYLVLTGATGIYEPVTV